MTEPIKIPHFLANAPDWRVVSDGAVAYYPTESLAASAGFVIHSEMSAALSLFRFEAAPSNASLPPLPATEWHIEHFWAA